MTKQYAIFNPASGEYTKATTEEERNNLLLQFIWDFFLVHTHNNPYRVVISNEDGSETWREPEGDEILADDTKIKTWLIDQVNKNIT